MANPSLSELITSTIGDGWQKDLCQLGDLLKHTSNSDLLERWSDVKQLNKVRLASTIQSDLGVTVDVDSMFDCQVKRIHEYKRQLLNMLHVITLFNRIRDGVPSVIPRTVIIAGKAAPGYGTAKTIIKLIHAVAEVVNHDPRVNDQLKVVFLPNYNVSLAEQIIPATDLSEQISTAGTAASGTGNMKSMLNGAVTIGTLDGANIEILEVVGEESIFIFGKNADEVEQAVARGYDPQSAYEQQPELQRAVDMIRDGFFSSGDNSTFRPLIDQLFQSRERFLVFDEYTAYVECQDRVAQAYLDQEAWTRKSIINTARASRFSSDRTVLNYARNIWGLDV